LTVEPSQIPSIVPSPLEGAPAADAYVSRCRIIDFPKIEDARGNLTFIEGDRHVDFGIKRVYYLYDVPGGAERGGHAHKGLHQLLIAMSGSFDVLVDDGVQRQRFHLNRSYYGLYIPPMIWREIDNFSSGSVCMVLASEYYDEADYYRDRDEFKAAALGA
jgi:dTDP-4-dehydrorhamnose 3,5-epimerase-like enzyme